MSTADQVIEASKLALDLIKTIVDEGHNPAAEMQRLIDVRKQVREADADAQDALNRKFPGD